MSLPIINCCSLIYVSLVYFHSHNIKHNNKQQNTQPYLTRTNTHTRIHTPLRRLLHHLLLHLSFPLQQSFRLGYILNTTGDVVREGCVGGDGSVFCYDIIWVFTNWEGTLYFFFLLLVGCLLLVDYYYLYVTRRIETNSYL